MSTDFPGLRTGLCSFTFSDGRCCTNLRHPTHPHLCYPHARKEAVLLAEREAGSVLCHEIKRNYVTACDLTWTVSRVFEAVASGRLKPKTARTLAYLAQIMAQTIPLAQHEFVESVGRKRWAVAVSESFPTQGNPRYDDIPDDDKDDAESDKNPSGNSNEQTTTDSSAATSETPPRDAH
jgi:hypothetical protein